MWHYTKANKQLITELLNERKIWARVFGIEDSRTVYNPVIKHHIRSFRKIKKVSVRQHH